jgi:hypothetical protein
VSDQFQAIAQANPSSAFMESAVLQVEHHSEPCVDIQDSKAELLEVQGM